MCKCSSFFKVALILSACTRKMADTLAGLQGLQSQSSSSCCICRVSPSLWTFFAKDTWGYDSSVVLWRRWNQIMTYWVSDWQGHQLRCPGQLIMNQILIAALLWLYRAHKRNVMLFPGPSFNLLSPSTVDFLVLAFFMTRGRAPNKILISFF